MSNQRVRCFESQHTNESNQRIFSNMKTIVLLLLVVCLVGCNNKDNQNNSNEDTSELFTETVVSNDTPITKKEPVTLDFPSYHLYADDSEKYDDSGFQPVNAEITIDEDAKKALLKLYDSGNRQWYQFPFRIDSKKILSENSVMFLVWNNVNKKSYIHVIIDDTEGIYIDVKYFEFEGSQIACWMKDNDNTTTVTYSETPNTYSSTPNTYSSPNLNGGTIHSDERIYSDFYNYEETDDCVEGVVVYEGSGDYYIVETKRGYTILERNFGRLDEGDKVRGELNRYHSHYLINRNKNEEVKVFIQDYMLSDERALEWLGEHEKLKDDDQEAYDANNQ